jgi:hypothetical protein
MPAVQQPMYTNMRALLVPPVLQDSDDEVLVIGKQHAALKHHAAQTVAACSASSGAPGTDPAQQVSEWTGGVCRSPSSGLGSSQVLWLCGFRLCMACICCACALYLLCTCGVSACRFTARTFKAMTQHLAVCAPVPEYMLSSSAYLPLLQC